MILLNVLIEFCSIKRNSLKSRRTIRTNTILRMATESIDADADTTQEIEKSLQNVVLDIQARHRREKKELQAKIQALKRNAPTSHKKLRKEVMEEISRLETEIANRHAKEIKEISLDIDQKEGLSEESSNHLLPVNELHKSEDNSRRDPPSEEGGTTSLRISKAQRRRDKKAKENREREERYAAALEEVDTSSPKAIEDRKLQTKLKERQLKLHYVSSNGDCLYNAVSHQMALNKNLNLNVSYLREITANYIECDKDNLLPYMTNPETGDLLTDVEYQKYCDDIRNTSAWGGEIELKALSTMLKVPIEVLQADGTLSILGEEYEGDPLIITYHRHLYSLGEHYNSTVPLSKENSINNAD